MATKASDTLADHKSAQHVLDYVPQPPPSGFDIHGYAASHKHSIALIYCRYSSDMQSPESNVIQEAVCRQWLDRMGLGHLKVVVVSDEEISGTKTDRPGLNQAMVLVRKKLVHVMVVAELSRISRSDTAIKIVKKANSKQARFVAIRDGIDTDNRGWQQSTRFADAHHSSASEMTAVRVRDGQSRRIRDGNGSAGDFPVGYSSVYRDSAEARAASRSRVFRKDVVIDDVGADIVRLIFSMFNAEVRIPAIVRHLIDKGIPPPRRCKNGWSDYVVRRILSNRKYIGEWIYGATMTVNDGDGNKTHVPAKPEDITVVQRPDLRIIADEVFAEAQVRLAAYAEVSGMKPGGKKRGPTCDFRIMHLNSVTGGLIHCSECGVKLHVSGSSKDVVRLGCPNHAKGTCSRVVRVVRDQAETLCAAALRECLLAVPAFLPAMMAYLKDAVATAVAQVPQERDRAAADLAIVEKKVANLTDAIADGLGDKTVRDKLKGFLADRDLLKSRLSCLGPAITPNVPDEAWVLKQMQELASVLTDGDPALLLIVRKCIGRIDADAVVAPGKVRGFARLRLLIDVPGIVDGLLRQKLPAGLALVLPPAADPAGVIALTIDLGKPTRSDLFAGQIRAWRHQTPSVSWSEISRRLDMPIAQCQIAYKRGGDADTRPEAA